MGWSCYLVFQVFLLGDVWEKEQEKNIDILTTAVKNNAGGVGKTLVVFWGGSSLGRIWLLMTFRYMILVWLKNKFMHDVGDIVSKVAKCLMSIFSYNKPCYRFLWGGLLF